MLSPREKAFSEEHTGRRYIGASQRREQRGRPFEPRNGRGDRKRERTFSGLRPISSVFFYESQRGYPYRLLQK